MRKVAGLLASLCLCAGCDDELPRAAQSAVSTGQFVVDYTAEAGAATRAIQENQPKGVRINSLTYLLYNSEGHLEKRREIPGLEGDAERWPLQRDNMSWEQREALKDTLFQDATYHVVFVANIDSAICQWRDEEGALWSPLRETEAYSTVHLQMPYQPFTDRNMFYVFTKDVHSTDQDADRENPYSCPVVLRRVVTRTDFLFEQLPVWEESTTEGGAETPGGGTEETPGAGSTPDEGVGTPGEGSAPGEGATTPDEGGATPGEGTGAPSEGTGAEEGLEGEGTQTNSDAYPAPCTLPKPIENYFMADIYNMVLTTNQEKLNKQLEDATVNLIAELRKYFSGWSYRTYQNRLDAIKKQIQGDGKSEFLNEINQEGKGEDNPLSNLQVHLIHSLLNDLADNATIRKLFEQSANRKLGQFATIGYEGKSRMNKYYLSGKNPESSLEKSPRIETDLTAKREDLPYLGFQWIGLANPAMNKIATVSWYPTADAATESETLAPTEAILTEQGLNEKCTVFYRPIKHINLKEGQNGTKATQIVCNLRTALPFADTDSLMVTDFNNALKGGKIKGYTTILEEMKLTINYPDITNTNGEVLEITEAWEISKN